MILIYKGISAGILNSCKISIAKPIRNLHFFPSLRFVVPKRSKVSLNTYFHCTVTKSKDLVTEPDKCYGDETPHPIRLFFLYTYK